MILVFNFCTFITRLAQEQPKGDKTISYVSYICIKFSELSHNYV